MATTHAYTVITRRTRLPFMKRAQYRWRIERSGHIIATSGESYNNMEDMVAALCNVTGIKPRDFQRRKVNGSDWLGPGRHFVSRDLNDGAVFVSAFSGESVA